MGTLQRCHLKKEVTMDRIWDWPKLGKLPRADQGTLEKKDRTWLALGKERAEDDSGQAM